MSDDLQNDPKFRSTINRLEALKHIAKSGAEYWLAREIVDVFGYTDWRNFESVVVRAGTSLTANDVDASHHIVETTNMMTVGKSAQREGKDYFLSRAACYLIAMNGDPSKREIAASQAYFAVSTRVAEKRNEVTDDEKRLELRDKVTRTFKTVSGVAQEAGVAGPKQAIFHDARYLGLYGMSRRDVLATKGLHMKDNPFDRMGALELSANDFQMNLAAETISKEGIRNGAAAIAKNKQIAAKVRATMIDSGSVPPENLPVAEPIKEVRKRLKVKRPPQIV